MGTKPEHRLRDRKAFQRVYRQGRAYADRLAVLYVFPRRESSAAGPGGAPGEPGGVRIGFVVGRRLGSAVERNRVKRRLREAARPRLAGVRGPVDLVLVARSRAREADFAQLDAVVGRLFREAGFQAVAREGGTAS